jgi:hypothetical protein
MFFDDLVGKYLAQTVGDGCDVRVGTLGGCKTNCKTLGFVLSLFRGRGDVPGQCEWGCL